MHVSMGTTDGTLSGSFATWERLTLDSQAKNARTIDCESRNNPDKDCWVSTMPSFPPHPMY